MPLLLDVRAFSLSRIESLPSSETPAATSRFAIFYHTRGTPLHFQPALRQPLEPGQKLMSSAPCAPTNNPGDFCLLKLEWKPTELAQRYGESWEPGPAHTAPITEREHLMLRELLRPPIQGQSLPLWYEGKALELTAFALQGPTRVQSRISLLNHDRAERARGLIETEFVEPPSLQEIARRVGCSPSYLSRIFSGVVGMSIPQYIRKCRILKAAELLSAGRHNVTEAAFAVGYSSLGHFSTAFREITGCCPGLFPLVQQRRELASQR